MFRPTLIVCIVYRRRSLLGHESLIFCVHFPLNLYRRIPGRVNIIRLSWPLIIVWLTTMPPYQWTSHYRPKLGIIGPLWGNPPVTGGFPSQKNSPMSWRHQMTMAKTQCGHPQAMPFLIKNMWCCSKKQQHKTVPTIMVCTGNRNMPCRQCVRTELTL